MAQTYSTESKEEACKRVQSVIPAAQVAREFGINVNTLYTWMSRVREHPTETFVGSISEQGRKPKLECSSIYGYFMTGSVSTKQTTI